MSLNVIDGSMLKDMFMAGAVLIEKNRQTIDALNVFPVPDGDTGTNMFQTITAAVREMNSRELYSAGEVAAAVARGALKGARGNSGVILSQIFRGFAKAIDKAEVIDIGLMIEALKQGSETAYKAVMKPKEGTILTVSRVIAEDAVKSPRNFTSMNDLMSFVLMSGESILRKTTEMLPALKQAGVVDSGGKGLVVIYTGFLAALNGEHIDDKIIESNTSSVYTEIADEVFENIEDIKYAYCTEFIVSHPRPDMKDIEVVRLRERLERIGDCALVISDGEVVKVHVHTNEPGKAIQMALTLGELDAIKIDNMLEEFRERMEKKERSKAKIEPKEFGLVSVALGEGLSSIFSDLAVDKIVDGGQTMNPSIDDLLQAIEKTPSSNVFVFPNNSNIILAAQQAAELTEKTVRVIPTKSVPQGIAAAVAFQPNATLDENTKAMTEAALAVKTGQITYAVRDTTFDGNDIHEGDIMGLKDGKIVTLGKSVFDVAVTLLEQMIDDDSELITIFYGQDTSKEEAQALAQKATEIYDMCDIEVHFGGQPLYYYLFSVE